MRYSWLAHGTQMSRSADLPQQARTRAGLLRSGRDRSHRRLRRRLRYHVEQNIGRDPAGEHALRLRAVEVAFPSCDNDRRDAVADQIAAGTRHPDKPPVVSLTAAWSR